LSEVKKVTGSFSTISKEDQNILFLQDKKRFDIRLALSR